MMAVRRPAVAPTPPEMEILLWLARGKSKPEIAQIVGRSPLTMKRRLETAQRRLGVFGATAAVVRAIARGYLVLNGDQIEIAERNVS